MLVYFEQIDEKLYHRDPWEQICTFKTKDKEAMHACVKKFKDFIGLHYIRVVEMEVAKFLNEAQTLEIADKCGVAIAA